MKNRKQNDKKATEMTLNFSQMRNKFFMHTGILFCALLMYTWHNIWECFTWLIFFTLKILRYFKKKILHLHNESIFTTNTQKYLIVYISHSHKGSINLNLTHFDVLEKTILTSILMSITFTILTFTIIKTKIFSHLNFLLRKAMLKSLLQRLYMCVLVW